MRWKSIGLVVASAVVLLAAGAWALQSWLAAPQAPQGEALIESEFSLVNHAGKPVTDEDFEGTWQLVFFGFTSCPDVCPTMLNDVSAVLMELGNDAEKVAPLFISVDPERDTPQVMAEYVANFDPRIAGLTGSPEQIKEASQAFRAYYAKAKQEGGSDSYTMDHSAFLYLMDPEGEYASHFSPSDEPVTIAKKVRAYLTEESTT
jgi:cytochrome oxidase Cu insertion factor (SCO1/SenC/PrrC family)